MYEFEIMLTGYSLAVVTASVVISKICINKKINALKQLIHQLYSESNRLKCEVERLSGENK